MAHESALSSGIGEGRVRVRTPGKYIVLFLFAPVAIVALGAGIYLNTIENRSNIAALEYRSAADGAQNAYFNLPEFLVDMAPDLDGRTAYLKLRASIAIKDAEPAKIAAQIEAVKPQLVERVTFFLRELRPEDFDGSESMERVKNEMLKRANLVLAPASVDSIIIEELVIQ